MKILVATDEGDTLAETARRQGHSADVAVDGAALARLATEAFDVVVIDWTRELRSVAELRAASTGAIWLLALCPRSTAAEAIRAGVDDCLVAPAVPDALELRLAVAAAALAERRAASPGSSGVASRHREIVRTAPVGFFEACGDGTLLFANDPVARLIGLERGEELVGHPLDPLCGGPRARERLLSALAGHREVRGVAARTAPRSGSERDVVLWARLGDDAVVQGFAVDVTEVKRAESELRETLELNRRILEAMPGGVVHVRADGSIVGANAEALRLLGLAYDELTGRYLADFETSTIHEDGSPCPPEHYPVSRALATGAPDGPHTIGVRRPDRTVSWAVFTAVPVKDPATGRTVAAVVTFLDITERREAEQAVRALEAQLQQAQKLESLGLLAGGIAHDFNNLLAAILGNATLTRLQLGPESDASESIAAIEAAAQRAADLTAQMLAYTGRGKLEMRPVDLSEQVREMAKLLSTVVSKKATLQCDLADGLPLVVGDPGQLQQVAMNLLVNASDALEDRPGTIVVKTSVEHATRDVLRRTYPDEGLVEGSYVVLEVSDTGSGMDAATRARVFDPFFTTKPTGRGLGLAATLGIVRGHGGAVLLESEPGRGTRFRIYLPCSGTPEQRPRPSASVSADETGGATVLVVDDEALVRSVTCQMLESFGYTTLSAAGGRESIELFEQHANSIDLVLLDVTMPDMSGTEVLLELRNRCPDVQVLLCSGYSESEVVERLAEGGAAGFLHKPYSLNGLLDKVREILARTPRCD